MRAGLLIHMRRLQVEREEALLTEIRRLEALTTAPPISLEIVPTAVSDECLKSINSVLAAAHPLLDVFLPDGSWPRPLRADLMIVHVQGEGTIFHMGHLRALAEQLRALRDVCASDECWTRSGPELPHA